jgi:hypothetical protein
MFVVTLLYLIFECLVVTFSLVIYVLFLKNFFVVYILMFSVEFFLPAPIMYFLWAYFLDLYCGVDVCTESVVCLTSENVTTRHSKIRYNRVTTNIDTFYTYIPDYGICLTRDNSTDPLNIK